MATKKDISSPKKGMNKEVHESELGKTEYSFALNANFTDEHGNGQIMLQNEPSNIYCSGFKEGYKVIGHKYDVNSDNTYFFLVNPTTGAGEIGYINSITNISTLQQIEDNCQCNVKVILETPLEGVVQEGTCNYVTLVDDICGFTIGAFTFSIYHPIQERNIQIKKERLGTTIYWTDGFNPPRYIQLNDAGTQIQDHYLLNTELGCTEEPSPKCITADELRVFKMFNKPCLSVDAITDGGNLRAGMYEVLMAYCNQTGDLMSQYYSMTNPIAIFDKNNNILDQTNLDYPTNQAIRLTIGNLDSKYEYFSVAVIQHSGLDGAVRCHKYNIYTTDTNTITINAIPSKVSTTLEELIAARPNILTSGGMANANGRLFQYDIVEQRDVNLQPVVNLMGAFAKWATVQAKEKLYTDGVNVSKYKGFMRDEVQPFGLRFLFDGGYQTTVFPLVPRPATQSEKTEVVSAGIATPPDTNIESVLQFNPECADSDRKYRWQYENTAPADSVVDSTCLVAGVDYVLDTRPATFSCIVDDTLTPVAPSTIAYVSSLGLIDYINTHVDEIRAYSGTDAGFLAIQDKILDVEADALITCTPTVGSLECGTLVPSTDTDLTYAFALGTPSETIIYTDAVPANYERVKAPEICNHIAIDATTGEPATDTAISRYISTTSSTYKRSNVSNTDYTKSLELPLITVPQTSTPRHLVNKVSTSIAGLQTTIPATASAPDGYTDKLHTNANWYKLTFGDKTNMIAELSTILCDYTDANSGTSLRVSVYSYSGSTPTQVGTSIIITNLTTYADATHFLQLAKSSFTGGVAYIAIDSPMASTVRRHVFQIKDIAVGWNVIINGTAYIQLFTGTDHNAAIREFMEDHAANILTEQGVVVTHESNDQITFYTSPGTTVAIEFEEFREVISNDLFYSLKPPCGCFNIVKRNIEQLKNVSFTGLTLGKKVTFTTTCNYSIPVLGNCDVAPHKKGKFAYWESTETYPCNEELFNSQTLTISPSDIPASIVEDFEEYFKSTLNGQGDYVLNTNANLANAPIRHYKFPDNKIIPFMNTVDNLAGDFKDSIIYPIGFHLDTATINAFLDIALNNGLITVEERAKITHYEILRGDRRISKSVIAKGLLFDMFSEKDKDHNLYANYPLNSLGNDQMNGNVQSQWYNSGGNVNYAFHSPDTHFYNPTLPRELSIDGYVYGKSRSYFDTVDGHPTYTVLGQGAFTLASVLGGAEAALEVLAKTGDWMVLGGTGGISSGISVASAITYGALYVAAAVMNAGKYRLQWIQTLYDLGHPTNHAYYQVAVGHYNYFTPNTTQNSLLRGLSVSHYLKEGLWTVADEYAGETYKVNNRDRENSVFLSLNSDTYKLNYPAEYIGYDNEYSNSGNASRRGYSGKGKSPELIGNAASPYVTLKQYNPSQYGNLGSISWLTTGFCGKTSDPVDDCNPVFGGDTYISRFSVKRKFPFFSTTAFGLAPLTPYIYSYYWNINAGDEGSSRYYLNYKLIDEGTDSVGIDGLFFPSQRSQYRLQYEQTGSHLYVNPEAKFYLYSYGFPHFLVESQFNCNYRYAGREMSENFYPNIGDIISYTQEKNVPIRENEKFNYNTVYSTTQSKTLVDTLPSNYTREVHDKLAISKNGVIFSNLDNTETSLTDPWLVYNGLNSHVFPTDYGSLTDISAIESGNLLMRFTNGLTMTMSEANNDSSLVATMFTQSKSFNKTDLGYAGSQNKMMVSCEFGHFWVDAKRGRVFNMQPGGQGLTDITNGLEKWLKENLPFNISKQIPNANIDNAYNGAGITMGWDDRLKRVFLTKKDFKPKSLPIQFLYNDEIGYHYIGLTPTPISLTDTAFFEDCSWTLAYSPLSQSWTSYYSFKPNYYVNYTNYFQTGINYSATPSEIGIWSHFSFLSSYQVFYGKLYPFTIEYAVPSKYSNSVMEAVEYMLDVRKYYDKYDYTDIYGIGFNQAVVYNNQQNSGLLNLHHQKENNIKQQLDYPKHNLASIDILQSCINNKWNFNYLYNLIKSDKSGLPIWHFDAAKVIKSIDSKLLDYRPTFKDRLRGNYFKVQLSNTLESRYKFIFQYAIDERNYYEQ